MLKKIYFQEDDIEETLSGEIQIILLGQNSFHEREAPILCGDFGQARILIPQENPLEQPTLTALQSKTITVRGIWKRGALHIHSKDIIIQQPKIQSMEKVNTDEPNAEEVNSNLSKEP